MHYGTAPPATPPPRSSDSKASFGIAPASTQRAARAVRVSVNKLHQIAKRGKTSENILWVVRSVYDQWKCQFGGGKHCGPSDGIALRLFKGDAPGYGGKGLVELFIYKMRMKEFVRTRPDLKNITHARIKTINLFACMAQARLGDNFHISPLRTEWLDGYSRWSPAVRDSFRTTINTHADYRRLCGFPHEAAQVDLTWRGGWPPSAENAFQLVEAAACGRFMILVSGKLVY